MTAATHVSKLRPDDDDHTLVARWSAGDRDAGRRFAQRHFDTLWRYFKNKVSHDPEDLVQATMLACARYQSRLASADDIPVYLLAIARNVLRAHLRRNFARPCFESVSLQDLGTTPSEAVARSSRDAALLDALRALPLAQQEVIELHYWNELDGPRIAAVLDVPEGTVRSRLRAAKLALRARLATAETALDRLSDRES